MMRCPICSEEVNAEDQAERWGTEFAHARCVTAYNAGKTDERERRKRAPLTEGQIGDMLSEANRGFCIERDDYTKAVRDAESAHGIGPNVLVTWPQRPAQADE